MSWAAAVVASVIAKSAQPKFVGGGLQVAKSGQVVDDQIDRLARDLRCRQAALQQFRQLPDRLQLA